MTPATAAASDAEDQVAHWLARVKVLPVLTVFDVRTVEATCRALGGINDHTIGQYLELPCVLACGASWLCAQDLVAAGRFDEIRRRAAATLGAPA
jgi:2-keto-3-deoxy-6-phosphogluconate aldolase